MKIFVDGHILTSTLLKEYPHFPYASRILSLAGTPQHQLFTSPLSLVAACRASEEKCGAMKTKSKIAALASRISVVPIPVESVMLCIQNKDIANFEAGIEYYSALQAGVDCIVTNEERRYYFAGIPVKSPERFLLDYF